jgi:hypothetical protein
MLRNVLNRLLRLEAHRAAAESDGPTIAQVKRYYDTGDTTGIPPEWLALAAERESEAAKTLALFDDDETLSTGSV